MKLETIKAIQLIGDKMTPEEVVKAFNLGEKAKETSVPKDAEKQEKAKRESRPSRKGYSWTEEEDEKLIKAYMSGMEYKAIGKEIGRTAQAVRQRITVLRNEGKHDFRKVAKVIPWTTKEIEEIKAMLFRYRRPKNLFEKTKWMDGYCKRTGKNSGAIVSKIYSVYADMKIKGELPKSGEKDWVVTK